MIGFLQLVLDGMCKNEEEQREFLKQAMSCSKHLLGLINDVLDIAKIEAGKLALDVSAVDVEQLLHEVYTVTHVQAAQKGITLRCAMPPPGARVRADFNKTKQVLINLVGNSIKFTDKGSVTVRAVPRAEVGHVLFEVVDTGIGIPADRQRVIFEKFTQGDGSTTRRFGGTGLGLAISRSLVELMGGVIGVHSEGPGKGSRVFFSLPVWSDVREAEPAAEEPDRIEGPAQGALVLVVEDDPASRRFLTAVLQRSGYRTLEARSAEHGWLLTRRHLPAVVLLDYALTCAEDARLRTGWDLAERIATTQETRHIPLIFVTGFDVELKEKLRANAFARRPGHLQKPIDPQQLLATIEQQLGPAEGRCRRILLADDDPGVSAFVRKVLPESQYHLEVARGGEECLHVLRTQPHAFDLLVLDLMMPEVSGYDVLREMVLAGTGSELPVLVLTNYPEPNDEEERRLLEEGLVVDVLPKLAVHENPRLLAHTIEWHLDVLLGPEQREVA
jgi:CheY-like chemotaxis protein